MKIMYIHGFGSKFDETNPKVIALRELGEVVGCNIDYTQSITTITSQLKTFIIKNKIDLLVGCSMGGFYANRMGNIFKGLPNVMLNPAIEPNITLAKLKLDYLPKYLIQSYKDKFNKSGLGLLIVEIGDELIDANDTYKKIGSKFTSYKFSGGNHRFENIKKAIPLIKSYFDSVENVNGLHND